MVFIGIDPGLTGAVAIIRDTMTGALVEIIDTPTSKIERGNKKLKTGKSVKNEYLPAQMADIVSFADPAFNKKEEVYVFMENVHAMPAQGSVSMFNFGKGFGIWVGILAALSLQYSLITPQAWKKEMMPGMPKEKEASLIRASQLFPAMSSLLCKKTHVGRADALLIAAYGKRLFNDRGGRSSNGIL